MKDTPEQVLIGHLKEKHGGSIPLERVRVPHGSKPFEAAQALLREQQAQLWALKEQRERILASLKEKAKTLPPKSPERAQLYSDNTDLQELSGYIHKTQNHIAQTIEQQIIAPWEHYLNAIPYRIESDSDYAKRMVDVLGRRLVGKRGTWLTPCEGLPKGRSCKDVHASQAESIQQWIEYLTNPVHNIPGWVGFLIAEHLRTWGAFKERTDDTPAHFDTRNKGTIAPYPIVNHFAVGRINKMLCDWAGHGRSISALPDMGDETENDFVHDAIKRADITALYAHLLQKSKDQMRAREALFAEGGEHIPLTWRKFENGQEQELADLSSDAKTGNSWCLGNKEDARGYLQKGPVHVGFAEHSGLQYPSVGIFVSDTDPDDIEVRGADDDQEISHRYYKAVEEKFDELGIGGELLETLQQLAALKRIVESDDATLIPSDLRRMHFGTWKDMEGFGYGRADKELITRCKKWIKTRDLRADLAAVLSEDYGRTIDPKEIAYRVKDITQDTKYFYYPKRLTSSLWMNNWDKFSKVELVYPHVDPEDSDWSMWDEDVARYVPGLKFPEGVHGLDFTNCILPSLRGIHFPESLSKLAISETNIESLEGAVYPSNLTLMSFHRCGITNDILQKATFPATLSDLHLFYNPITSLRGVTFPPELKHLDLYGSDVSSLKDAVFPDTLETLDIQYTPIDTLEDFMPSPHLRKIRLGWKLCDSIQKDPKLKKRLSNIYIDSPTGGGL